MKWFGRWSNAADVKQAVVAEAPGGWPAETPPVLTEANPDGAGESTGPDVIEAAGDPAGGAAEPALAACNGEEVHRVQDGLTDLVAAVAAKQQELNELFLSRLQSDELQAAALESLHDELKSYKHNFVRQATLSILKDVIHCYDFLTGEVERLRDAPGDARSSLEHACQVLLDLLFKHDVEPFRGEQPTFDRLVQQCVRVVPADSPEEDLKIVSRGAAGFREGGTVLRKEQVVVARYALLAKSTE
jgi:molecular chaperone GrpE (heat shock protein)